MTDQFFSFGRRLPEYEVPVLNERAVRAAAGSLFFFAMVSFMNAWLLGNFAPTRVFVVAFLIDFTIRLFVNPHYAPSMVIGRGACEYTPDPHQRLVGGQIISVMLFAALITFAAPQLAGGGAIRSSSLATDAGNVADPKEVERCKVPDFAKAMGHEEKWKLHNNCR